MAAIALEKVYNPKTSFDAVYSVRRVVHCPFGLR
jgi:hypothetical protein